MKLSLNLAGGGSRGILQAGYIKALSETQAKPDFVFGTSVGSLNGCMYVQGDIDRMEELWLTISNDKVYKFHFWTVPQILFSRNHLYDSSPLGQLIDKFVDFEKLRAKGSHFKITATNVTDWKTESYGPTDLTEEEFKTFLLASASPPMCFPPVEFRGKLYGDGGLINNFNVSNAVRAGADYVLVMTPTVREDTKVNNMIDMFNLLVSIPEYCYLDRELSFLDKINDIQAPFPNLREIKHFVLRPPEGSGIGLLDFQYKGMDRKELMQRSYELARGKLAHLFDEV